MRTLLSGLVIALVWSASASAEPAVVDVRVEGATKTLFEGRVRTDGHAIRATSDTQDRRCDGTNNDMHPTPGPTATGATVDALAITGRGFDGQWYPGFDDYFIQQFGPDRENGDTFAYWGILVDEALTSVGGCQYQVEAGDRVLWQYDAFNGKPYLMLSGPATAAVGTPLTVTVERTADGSDPAPVGAVTVAPVQTDAVGDQTVLTADPAAVTTAADGTATVTFGSAGWHRLKAAGTGFQRSNRLDVCVGACGPAPADTLVRSLADPNPTPVPTATATATATPDATATATATATPDATATATATAPATPQLAPAAPASPLPAPGPAALRLAAPELRSDGARRGELAVRWSVLAGSPRTWAIDAAPAGTTAFRRAASGTTEQAASLRLAAGRSYDLRLSVTDSAGRVTTVPAGRAVAWLDDRAVAKRGWTRVADASAWRGTLSRGAQGATANVRLAAGRPVLLVRGSGRVQVGARTLRVNGRMTLTATRRAKAGSVRVRVLSGRIGLDGIAVAP